MPEPANHRLPVAGVGDQKVAVFGQPVENRVVDDAPGFIAYHAVPGPSRGQRGRGGGQHPVQELGGLGAGNVEPPHVRNVKQAHAGSHGVNFRQDAGVLYRHVPAAKGHHACPQGAVGGVEGCFKVRFDQSRLLSCGVLRERSSRGRD